MDLSFIPKLKLNFSITKTTSIAPKTVIDLLVVELEDREYKILDETNNSLVFYSSAWRLRWNFQRYIAFNGGDVDVGISRNGNSIIFNYYLDFFPLLLLVSFAIFSTIVDRDYNWDLLVAGVFIFNAAMSVVRAKWAAKSILTKVLKQEVVN